MCDKKCMIEKFVLYLESNFYTSIKLYFWIYCFETFQEILLCVLLCFNLWNKLSEITDNELSESNRNRISYCRVMRGNISAEECTFPIISKSSLEDSQMVSVCAI